MSARWNQKRPRCNSTRPGANGGLKSSVPGNSGKRLAPGCPPPLPPPSQARCRADRWSQSARHLALHTGPRAACPTCRRRIRLLVSLRLSCCSDCRRGQRVHRAASHVSPLAHVTSSRARPASPAHASSCPAWPRPRQPRHAPPLTPSDEATPQPRGFGRGGVRQLCCQSANPCTTPAA